MRGNTMVTSCFLPKDIWTYFFPFPFIGVLEGPASLYVFYSSSSSPPKSSCVVVYDTGLFFCCPCSMPSWVLGSLESFLSSSTYVVGQAISNIRFGSTVVFGGSIWIYYIFSLTNVGLIGSGEGLVSTSTTPSIYVWLSTSISISYNIPNVQLGYAM